MSCKSWHAHITDMFCTFKVAMVAPAQPIRCVDAALCTWKRNTEPPYLTDRTDLQECAQIMDDIYTRLVLRLLLAH